MTGFDLQAVAFEKTAVQEWGKLATRHRNWPVVYVIDSGSNTPTQKSLLDVYVGETLNAEKRILQHIDSPNKKGLVAVRVVLDDTYNKSACLDLEANLIRLLSGD